MKYFLLRMKFNGIKSLDKEIQIDFYNSTLTKKLDFINSHVKSIYGPNGAGKTAIVYAVEIYRNLILNGDYMSLNNINHRFDELVNQITKKFEIEMTFTSINNDNMHGNIYSHYISIEQIDEKFVISEEKFSKLTGNNLNNSEKYSVIYQTKNGDVVALNECLSADLIKEAAKNLLYQNSFEYILLSKKLVNKESVGEKFMMAFTDLVLFANGLNVMLQTSDTNYINAAFIVEQLNAINRQKEALNNDEIFVKLLNYNRIPIQTSKRIMKDDFSSYQKFVNCMVRFIKVFKDDLADIEIKKDENGNFYQCENILVYQDGKKINEKYESTGIKKLMELYAALCVVDKGGIVFIDEFDANLHDVLLIRLVEYVMQYAKGQLVFTTHNLGPMEVLQSAKHSIDFLSPDSHLVPWVKNGNYRAEKVYRKGLIDYSPFNIEAFSFLGTFGEEE